MNDEHQDRRRQETPEINRESRTTTRTEWIALDPETDRGEHGLTPLLLHRLGHEVDRQAREPSRRCWLKS